MIVGSRDINWYEYLSGFGLLPETKKRRKAQKNIRLLNVFSAFDIETSTVWLSDDRSEYNVHSFMYVWQFQLEDYTVMGRTWEEFFDWLKLLGEAIEHIRRDNALEDKPFMVIWVHNLQFEWTFLSGIYPFRNDEIFFRDVRKPIYCRMFDMFELRCSYIQTNLSLAALCKQTGVPEKLSGQKFDYEKIRFPWTQLSDFETEYAIRDVESLVAAMKYRVLKGGDDLQTVPITSTGYVRRECKESLKDKYLLLRSLKPMEQEYRLLRRCFRGGNTHANRAMVGKIIDDVYSYDISSSYPTQQLTQLFPMKQFKWLDLNGSTPDERMKRVFTFIGLGYAVVATYQFSMLELKDKTEPIPYISLSKCHAMGDKKKGLVIDNGRILECEYIEITLTEIDLEIVLEQYDYNELDVTEAMVAQKDYLPEEYRTVIQEYYNKKTALKGDDSEDGKYMYIKSKNMLNAIYGMSATNSVHNQIEYLNGTYKISSYEDYTEEELRKKLLNAPFPYQWGCYTTALARYQLEQAIKLCKRYGKYGNDTILYCDTDSIKTRGPVPIEKLNDVLLKRAIQNKAYADDMNGTRHYIGLFEPDGHYQKFITQGSKRYAYIDDNGHMGITVAGVSKKINEDTGVPFAVEELGSLDNFHPDIVNEDGKVIKEGITWKKAGGTIAVYNDHDDFMYTDPETGKQVHITKNIAIVPSTYTMKYSRDYSLLLREIELYGVYQKARS